MKFSTFMTASDYFASYVFNFLKSYTFYSVYEHYRRTMYIHDLSLHNSYYICILIQGVRQKSYAKIIYKKL